MPGISLELHINSELSKAHPPLRRELYGHLYAHGIAIQGRSTSMYAYSAVDKAIGLKPS